MNCQHGGFEVTSKGYQVVMVRCEDCKRTFTKDEFSEMGLTVETFRTLDGFGSKVVPVDGMRSR